MLSERVEIPTSVVPIPVEETRPDTSPHDTRSVRDATYTAELFNKVGPSRIESALTTANLDGSPAFVLTAVPDQPTNIPDLFLRRSAVVKVMENPPHLRYAGFSPDAGSDSRIIGGELRRTLIPGHRILELWRDGTLIFAQIGSEDGLSWGNKVPDAYKVNQLALIETTLQFVTMAGDLYRHARPAPAKIQFWIELRRMMKRDKNAMLTSGIIEDFGMGDLKLAPKQAVSRTITVQSDQPAGRTAFTLVAEIYRWFGFDDDDIPYTDEAAEGRIISPQMIIDLHKK